VLSGAFWCCLVLSGAFWYFLVLSGTFWCFLVLSGLGLRPRNDAFEISCLI
jgi:hypothetical protein